MSEISIQVRRVTERVKQFYTIFGIRSFATLSSNRSVIKGSKRMGFNEIECVVAETSRGTSVGFYAVNQLQSVLHLIPIIFVLLIVGLSKLNGLGEFLTGGKDNISINFVKIFIGSGDFNFLFFVVLLLISIVIFGGDVLNQQIRLDNLKSRFSFYSRDALWQTREIPLPLVILTTFRSIFMHIWLLAVLYFGIFSSSNEVISDLSILYNSKTDELILATVDAFSITGGLVVGLLSAHKAILQRGDLSRYDERLRTSGSLTERRYDPMLFGIMSSLFNGVLIALFLSVTYFADGQLIHITQFLIFTLIGGLVAGFVYDEGKTWILATYAIFLFFSSLILIFRTGDQPAYAYIVILQLFFVPIPFLMIISQKFDDFLKKYNIRSNDWLYDTFPLTSIISVYVHLKNRETSRRSYEKMMGVELTPSQLDGKIVISKNMLQDPNSEPYRIVRHYFELLFTYSASFDENLFVILPTAQQLGKWWSSKSDQKIKPVGMKFFAISDKLLWDPEYLPSMDDLSGIEQVGKEMVLLIQ